MSILLGNGDGTFQPQTTFDEGDFASAIAVGDFNEDGKLDLAVTNRGYAGSGGIVRVLLNMSPTTTSVVLPTDSCTYGQSVTFTATVSGSSGVPSGIVTFLDGATILGTSALDATGTATLTLSTLHAGNRGITATYPGDTLNASSSSGAMPITISKADQTITWASPVQITQGMPLGDSQLGIGVTGVPGGSAPGALTYMPAACTVLASGVYTLSVTAAATSDYNAASASVPLAVLYPQARTATLLSQGSIMLGSDSDVAFGYIQDSSPGMTFSYDLNDDGTFEVLDSSSPMCQIPASYLGTPGTHTITGRIISPDGGYTDYSTTILVNLPMNYNPDPAGVTWPYTGVDAGKRFTQSRAYIPDEFNGTSVMRKHTERTFSDGAVDEFDSVGNSEGGQSSESETASGYTSMFYVTGTIPSLPLRDQPGLSVSWSDLPYTQDWSYTNGDTGGTSEGMESGTTTIVGMRSLTLANGLRFPVTLVDRHQTSRTGHIDWDNGVSADVTVKTVEMRYFVRGVGLVKDVGSTSYHYVYDNGFKRNRHVTFSEQLAALPDATRFLVMDGTTLRVNGTAQADIITFAVKGKTLTCYRNGVPDSVALASVRGIVINGLDGNDTIDASKLSIPVTINVGAGNDSILGSKASDSISSGDGNDTILSGKGNDTLWAGNGNNRIDGGAGDDRITVGSGRNTVHGGAGNDTITAGTGSNDQPDLLYGDAGQDSLTGGSGNDSIYAGAGNDTLAGGSGGDLLAGGSGTNRFEASDGAMDILDGRGGSKNTGLWDLLPVQDTILGKITRS